MKLSSSRKSIGVLVSSLHVLALCFAFLATPSVAQNLDTEPPVVGLDGIKESGKGEMQKFTVTATDNQKIESIVFYYRLQPGSEYTRAEMLRLGQSDQFTFGIKANEIAFSVNSIEYYIEAKDEAGNRTLQGYFFDPLERRLIDRKKLIAANEQSTKTETMSILGSLSTTQKILYGALGVVVVGALISAADSDENDTSSEPVVPVTIVVVN